MFNASAQRAAVQKWIAAQKEFPTRKQTMREFKNFPQKLVRAAYQGARDKTEESE